MAALRRAQIYQSKAKHLRDLAKAAKTVVARRELEDLAIHYEELAEHVAMLERFRIARSLSSDGGNEGRHISYSESVA
jgi:hypothetical protein